MPDEVTITHDEKGTTYTIRPAAKTLAHDASTGVAVKAVGDWELDVTPVPFGSTAQKDSDGQWFDHTTEIMHEVYDKPLVIYHHGIEQGGRGYQGKLVVVGKSVPGTLEKRADGWHVRVVLDKTIAAAKRIMEAARKGLVAVSSDSISHLARLDIGGKLIPYEKNRPGRIAVWPLAGFSLWEMGNGNFQPANRQAIALPVMKAIYREAGIPFPEATPKPTDGALPEASMDAAKRARREEIFNKANAYLKKVGKE
jgi:hypothetical protein